MTLWLSREVRRLEEATEDIEVSLMSLVGFAKVPNESQDLSCSGVFVHVAPLFKCSSLSSSWSWIICTLQLTLQIAPLQRGLPKELM